jgi:hypothetical protein
LKRVVIGVENAQLARASGIEALMLEGGAGFSAGFLAPTDPATGSPAQRLREPAIAIRRHGNREEFLLVLSTTVEN